MRAQDVMTLDVVTVEPTTDVREAARLMVEHHISGLPVIDKSRRVVGIVTDGDLYRRTEVGTDKQRHSWLELFGLGSSPVHDYVEAHGHSVGDVMTTRVFAVAPNTSLRLIADLLEREHIRRVPVIADGVLVGIVSRANLMRALISIPIEGDQMPLEDQRVRDLVVAEYKRLPWGVPSEGNVIVTDGVVHLWGFVPSETELDALRIAAEGIPGVKGFHNHTFRFFGDIGAHHRAPSQVIVKDSDDTVLEVTPT